MNLTVNNFAAPISFKAKEKTQRPNMYTPKDLEIAVDKAQRALNNYNEFPDVIYSRDRADSAAQIILLHNLTQKIDQLMKK